MHGKLQSMGRLEALARLMDGAFVIPGTTIRFGLDGIIVSSFGQDGNTGGGARHVHVQVNGSGYVGVIQFLDVNMEKRRL